MFKKILVPSDGSTQAHKAAEATLTSQGDLDFIRPILVLQYKERFQHIMEN